MDLLEKLNSFFLLWIISVLLGWSSFMRAQAIFSISRT